MNISRLLLLSLIPVLSIIHLHAIVPSNNKPDRKQVAEQMKQFHNRMYIYLKCLSPISTCTPEEREAAGKTAFNDGIKIIGALSIGTGLYLGKKYGWPQLKGYQYKWKQSKHMNYADIYFKKVEDYKKAKQNYDALTTADYSHVQPNSPEFIVARDKIKTAYDLMKKAEQEAEKYKILATKQ